MVRFAGQLVRALHSLISAEEAHPMRAVPILLLLVCVGVWLAPSDARAQDAEGTPAELTPAEPIEAEPVAPDTAPTTLDEFSDLGLDEEPAAGSGELLAPPLRTGVWVLDDEIGPEQDPWDDYDPGVSYTPRGLVHGGVALRVGGLMGGSPPSLPGPLGELSGFLDVRYGETVPFHLRVALGVAAQPAGSAFLGAGTSANTSPVSFRLRVQPLAFDIVNWAAIRLGGSLGVQLLEAPARGVWESEAFGGASLEVVLRFLDGLLEVGVFGGLQLTGISSTSRTEHRTGVTTQGALGVASAMVF